MLIDTAGCGMEEAADEDSDSKRNEGEAKVCTAPRAQAGGFSHLHLVQHAVASVLAGANAPVWRRENEVTPEIVKIATVSHVRSHAGCRWPWRMQTALCRLACSLPASASSHLTMLR